MDMEVPVHQSARRYVLLAGVLVVAGALSIATFFISRQWEASRAFAAFRGIADDRVHAIQEETSDQLARISFLSSYVDAYQELAVIDNSSFIGEFRSVVRETGMTDPAAVTVALIRKVAHRGPLGPAFRITSLSEKGNIEQAQQRASYYPIVAVEPAHMQDRLLGLDLSQNPVYEAAMTRAMDSGMPSATAPVRLPANPNGITGYWLFAPLYAGDKNAGSGEGTAATPYGYIAIEYDAELMIQRSLRELTAAGIDLVISDTDGGHAHEIFSSQSLQGSTVRAVPASRYTWETSLTVAGRTWRVVAHSSDQFVRAHTYWLSWAVLAGGTVSSLLLVLFLFWNMRRTDRVEHLVTARTAELTETIRRHQETEESLKRAHAELTDRIEIIRRHSEEIELLSEMGELLHTCQKVTETYAVLARFAGRLFPDEDGGLYVFSSSRRMLELVTEFGNGPGEQSVIEPASCWGLRRGKSYYGNHSPDDFQCDHVDPENRKQYLCIPLIAQGETVGLLHVRERSEESSAFEGSKRRLLEAVAENTALAIANLSLRETLRQQSMRDPLTGLYNRRHMEDSLEREIHRARRGAGTLAILIIDIDHFKDFNDLHSHEAGDVVLRQVSQTLHTLVRAEDIPCRFGGEEFVAILPGASLDIATQKAEMLRQTLGKLRIMYEGKQLPHVTVSIGVAIYPDHGEVGADVLRRADEALYRAKHAGRNRVTCAQAGSTAA